MAASVHAFTRATDWRHQIDIKGPEAVTNFQGTPVWQCQMVSKSARGTRKMSCTRHAVHALVRVDIWARFGRVFCQTLLSYLCLKGRAGAGHKAPKAGAMCFSRSTLLC